jgi:hypothetical protein
MDGFILTTTPRGEIPGADGKTWEELTRDYRLMDQTALDIPTLIGMPA